MKRAGRFFLFFLGAIFFLPGACSSQKSQEIRRVRLMMGTEVEIIAQGKNQNQLEQAVEKGFKEIKRLEQKLSRFQNHSLVSQINLQAGKSPVPVDEEVFYLLKTAKEICQESGGAFDPTILPALELWKFNQKNPQPPSSAEIKKRLKLVGCENLILDEEKKTAYLVKPGMAIDLGGIAKGYASDRVVKVLEENRVEAGIVNVGGDLRVFGAGGKGFAIGIRHPSKKNQIIAKIYLKDSAIATSGDYERYFIFQGERYSHILDPRSGYPARGERSVSVLAEKGILADAWATALFVLGSEKGMELVKAHPELEAVFIDADGTRKISPGLKGKIIWLEEEE